MGHNEEVDARELRQNLSVYLDRVKRGETLTVTEHRQVVAELRPPFSERDALGALLAAGLATASSRRPSELPRPVPRLRERALSRLVRDLGVDGV